MDVYNTGNGVREVYVLSLTQKKTGVASLASQEERHSRSGSDPISRARSEDSTPIGSQQRTGLPARKRRRGRENGVEELAFQAEVFSRAPAIHMYLCISTAKTGGGVRRCVPRRLPLIKSRSSHTVSYSCKLRDKEEDSYPLTFEKGSRNEGCLGAGPQGNSFMPLSPCPDAPDVLLQQLRRTVGPACLSSPPSLLKENKPLTSPP